VIGLLAAILRDRLDGRVRSAEEVAVLSGSPVVGVIPRLPRFARTRSKRRVSKAIRKLWLRPTSECGEAFRAVRTSLYLNSNRRESGSVVLVTSAVRGDGKSTFIANLAITTAQAGRRVLLIDADLRRPTQHVLMGVSNDIGVSDVLQECSVEVLKDGIQQTWLPGLSVLPCGRLPLNPSELLSSDRLALLISVVRECFDFVLIDSPPLTAVTDAQLLSSVCDETLLVVRANRSTRAAIESARDALLRVGAHVSGAILNDSPRYMRSYRNGYGGYQYGQTGVVSNTDIMDQRHNGHNGATASRLRSALDDGDSIGTLIDQNDKSAASRPEPARQDVVSAVTAGGSHERVG
jgi:succinoglycan biosynthesis transport protein ExoP